MILTNNADETQMNETSFIIYNNPNNPFELGSHPNEEWGLEMIIIEVET